MARIVSIGSYGLILGLIGLCLLYHRCALRCMRRQREPLLDQHAEPEANQERDAQ
jgi:hypothetical protein